MTVFAAESPMRSAAGPGHGEPAVCAPLVACVMQRARRRLAWLASLEGAPLDADTPEAERQWQVETDAGRMHTAAVARADAALAAQPGNPFDRLCETFGLSSVARDLLVGALAPRLDPGVLTVYHQLQSRPWPTEPLIARLFGYGRRAIWRPDGPLAAWSLVSEGESAPGEPPPLLADPALPFWLQEEPYTDSHLIGHVSVPANHPPLAIWPVTAVAARLRERQADGHPIRLVIEGAPGSGRATFAAALARTLGRHAIAVDTLPAEVPFARVWTLIQRSALVHGSLPIWRSATPAWPHTVRPAPLQAVCLEPGDTCRDEPAVIDEHVSLPPLDDDTKRRLLACTLPDSAAWPEAARSRLVQRPGVTLGDLTGLKRKQVTGAPDAERWLREAAAGRLGDLAERLETTFDWDDLVLPAALTESLRDFAFEAGSRVAVWNNPEMRRLFPGGRGLIALFAGPPGTGKTMAAQIIARDLGVDVFRIDLAMTMSKYIGETAKNLKRVFARAADMHAVLLFDEADALFASRTEVKDSHDRYANADTNYLLQQLEDFAGIAILATNRKTNIDTAFLRRIRYVFDFPRPDADSRRRLWRALAVPILGADAATALGPVLETLGTELDLSGAQIKNALMAGHFAARRRGADPALPDLLKGIERELAKEGRALSPREQQRLMRHA